MKQSTKEEIRNSIKGFSLPRYNDIPNVGLYLEQVVKYISEYLEPLGSFSITGSMVSNYVKKGLIENPIKKQYNREQIAYLIFIAVAKNVMSLDGLTNFIALQKRTYGLQKAYDYFCDQFEAMLFFTAEVNDTMSIVGEDTADENPKHNGNPAENCGLDRSVDGACTCDGRKVMSKKDGCLCGDVVHAVLELVSGSYAGSVNAPLFAEPLTIGDIAYDEDSAAY